MTSQVIGETMSSELSSGASSGQSSSTTFSILAIIFGGISFLFFPILFGPASIILAVIAKTKNEKLANVALTVGILGTVFGFILGAIVWSMF
jgi:hypothetical protein